ncbi:DnaJ-like subfamily C member 3 [Hondaea fermentalgiana]|uniref:DnaJ-like subfamily C member 3 n=1 Tax=Hondaea fermentalgiana TaxID=2315210 RepID=A0A2R5G7Q4_9STRA|nr:DnaJ-like subfamily C member 3 [Hondaea fermentalgiana]|eukprot:GBG26359.1 DnaJ-like subfamily C member 3 [Hondaea fermentalgiana]
MCPATAVAQSAQECSAEDAKEAKKKAGKLRSDGDDAMMKKQYAEALALYSEAISVEPNNEKNYYKRYKVHDKTGKHKAALEDIDHALEIKPDYLSAIGFRARTLMSLGRCMEAVEDFGRLLKAKPTHGDAKKLLPKARECARELGTGEQFMRQRNYAGAEKKFTDVMDNVGTSAHVKQLRAEARFRQGKFYESIADAGEVLKADPDNQEALLLRGRGYYLVGDHEMALRHFREGLKKDPEHVATKEALRKVQKLEKLNKDADAAVARGTTQSLKDAASLYAEAVKVDPEHREFNKKISTKLCAVHARLKQVKEAKLICEQAIRFDKNGIEPYVSLAELLSSMAEETPDFEEAVRAWHRAAEVEHDNRKVRDGLHRAEVALKQSKQKNYYKILGVARNADGGTIKKAYRKLAKETHPDRHGEKTEEERKLLQEKFELIAESYEVLSDDELRAKYDRGEDVFENQGNNQRQQHGGFPFRFHRRRP